MKTRFVFVVSILMFVACDGGLQATPPVEPGFSGTIHFASGTWPPTDSLVNLWIFASQIFPLDSALVFTGLFVQPQRIFLFPPDRDRIALNVDSTDYLFPVPPETYRYIGVIQRFRNDFSITSFRVVGFFNNPVKPDMPQQITVRDGETYSGVNIDVDFSKPPTQPF